MGRGEMGRFGFGERGRLRDGEKGTRLRLGAVEMFRWGEGRCGYGTCGGGYGEILRLGDFEIGRWGDWDIGRFGFDIWRFGEGI